MRLPTRSLSIIVVFLAFIFHKVV